MTDSKEVKDLRDLTCPVCGWFCIGHGGLGCIDKPKVVAGLTELKEKLNANKD